MTNLSSWLIGVTILPVSLLALTSYLSTRKRPPLSPESLPSALIPSYTSHARLLPSPAKHAFSYPLLYLGVDIDNLESGVLDLPGRFLTYGGSPWSKVLGVRSDNYLTPGPGSLRQKLDKLLIEYGVEKEDIGRAWMVSMPSYLGFEGINPLTVWFVYSAQREPSCVILEVHNTFGEKHAYVLPVNSEYKVESNPGYDQAWVFPRTFHVSPFNSRNGFYRLDIIDPFPPSSSPDRSLPIRPRWKVFLRLLTPDKTPKLTALVASHPTHQSIPLEPANIPSMIYALIRWPLTLFLSTPRILYHAYILQYLKKLSMFPRPEPRGEGQEGVWNPAENHVDQVGRSIGWQNVASSETWLRQVLLPLLQGRVEETSIGLEVIFRNELQPDIHLQAPDKQSTALTIITSDPSFFANLATSPTPRHFLALAPVTLTHVSDSSAFITLFSTNTRPIDRIDRHLTILRKRYFSWFISHSSVICPPDLMVYDDDQITSLLSYRDRLWLIYVTRMASFASWAEEAVMYLAGARFVAGSESWKLWERALRRLYLEAKADSRGIESELEKEGWEDLGSIQYT